MSIGCEEPIILLTGKGNREIDIKAMQSGATDYLVKSDPEHRKAGTLYSLCPGEGCRVKGTKGPGDQSIETCLRVQKM